MGYLYWDDLTAGQVIESGTVTVDAEMIEEFARKYDPQGFHLKDGDHQVFGGLIASGWQTASLTMRLLIDSVFGATTGTIGLEADKLKWPRPVRPGDTLRLVVTLHELRPLKSRTDFGLGKIEMQTFNQNDQLVQLLLVTVMIPRRPAESTEPA